MADVALLYCVTVDYPDECLPEWICKYVTTHWRCDFETPCS